MLTLVKYFAVIVGSVAGVVSVLVDYKNKRSGRLTVGGKLAISLIVLSLLVSITAQSLENRAEQDRNQKELLSAINRQTQLIETIRATNLPITEPFDVSVTFPLDEKLFYAKPYFDRIRAGARAPYSLKPSHPSYSVPLIFADNWGDAPRSETEKDLRYQLDRQEELATIWAEIAGPHGMGGLAILDSSSGTFECYLGKPDYHYVVRRPASDDISIEVHATAAVVKIQRSSKGFVSFADMAGKQIEFQSFVLDGVAPTNIVLTSKGKQLIEGSNFSHKTKKDNWHEFVVYAATLGNLR